MQVSPVAAYGCWGGSLLGDTLARCHSLKDQLRACRDNNLDLRQQLAACQGRVGATLARAFKAEAETEGARMQARRLEGELAAASEALGTERAARDALESHVAAVFANAQLSQGQEQGAAQRVAALGAALSVARGCVDALRRGRQSELGECAEKEQRAQAAAEAERDQLRAELEASRRKWQSLADRSVAAERQVAAELRAQVSAAGEEIARLQSQVRDMSLPPAAAPLEARESSMFRKDWNWTSARVLGRMVDEHHRQVADVLSKMGLPAFTDSAKRVYYEFQEQIARKDAELRKVRKRVHCLQQGLEQEMMSRRGLLRELEHDAWKLHIVTFYRGRHILKHEARRCPVPVRLEGQAEQADATSATQEARRPLSPSLREEASSPGSLRSVADSPERCSAAQAAEHAPRDRTPPVQRGVTMVWSKPQGPSAASKALRLDTVALTIAAFQPEKWALVSRKSLAATRIVYCYQYKVVHYLNHAVQTLQALPEDLRIPPLHLQEVGPPQAAISDFTMLRWRVQLSARGSPHYRKFVRRIDMCIYIFGQMRVELEDLGQDTYDYLVRLYAADRELADIQKGRHPRLRLKSR